ncbi:YihY/virulence factor BrkB family protein [Mucilaginibacter sp.]|uniref:YihY/virulence factor BrkB family protein n=1 Tax=Mucilaginibacter sp. TaxID=1882438 RepID=UPI0035BBD2EF
MKTIFNFFKEVFSGFTDDKALKFSASLSYYTVFSIAPFLAIIISVSGFFFNKQAIQGELYPQIHELVGDSAAIQIQDMITNIHLSGNSFFAAAISLLVLIAGATGIFVEIQDSINHIWGLKSKPKRGLIKMLLNRLISFSLIVSLGFLLMVSLLLNTLVNALSKQLLRLLPGNGVYVVDAVNNSVMFILISLLFGIIFKVLPDARIKWKDVMVGAITTAILFMIGKFAIGFYLGHSNMGNIYGTAGSIIIVMLWVYYSAVILYFGAEFTKVYAKHYGGEIRPNDYAVWIQTKEIELPKALE